MATPEAMIHAFRHMLAQQQAQTFDMMVKLQRHFQETVQRMVAGMKGAG